MASFNRVIMIGNLTRDPDYKQQASGQAVCRLSLASNRQFRNKQTGLMVQEVCYIDVDVWGNQAENCRQYLAKGRPVLVEGRLKLDTWKENESGQTRRRHSIVADRVVFLGSGQQAEAGTEDMQESSNASGSQRPNMKSKGNMDFSAEDGLSSDVSFKDEPPFTEDLPF